MVENNEDPTKATALVLEEHTAKISKQFNDLRNKEAAENIIKLKNSVEAGLVTLKSGEKVGNDTPALKEFLEGDIAKLLSWGYELSQEFYDCLDQLEYMEEHKHKDLLENDTKLYYKVENEGKTLKQIMEIKFPSDVVTMSGLFFEIDLMKEWFDGTNNDDIKYQVIAEPTACAQAMAFQFPIGMGMDDRCTRCQYLTNMDRSTNGVLNISCSLGKDQTKWFGVDVPPAPEKCVEMQIDKMFRYFEKTGDNQCKHIIYLELQVSKDMTLDTLINYVIKQKSVERCSQLQKTYRKVLPKYEERVNGTKKEFYDQVRAVYADDE